VHAAVVPKLERELSSTGLRLSWYDVLLELNAAPGRTLRMTELGARVVLSRERVSRVVAELERAGLVRREPNPDDGRSSFAVVTAQGRSRLRAAAPTYLAGIERHYTSHLSDQEVGRAGPGHPPARRIHRDAERLKRRQRPAGPGVIFRPRATGSAQLLERSTMSTRELAPDDVSTAPPPAVPLPLAGDPLVLGLPCFIVGSIALGLYLVGFVPAAAAGASLAILITTTGLGLIISTVWAAGIGQSLVSAVLGIFAGFWLSYSALVLGLTHGWFGVAAGDAVRTQELFLTAWVVTIFMLLVATPRLPLAFSVLFALVDLALIVVLLSTINASTGLQKLGGIVVFAFVAVGFYLFVNVASLATGGKALPLGKPLISG